MTAKTLVLSSLVSFATAGIGQSQIVPPNPNDWPMYNYDIFGTRHNTAEARLTRGNLKDLKIKWIYQTPGEVHATPVVVDHKIFFGDTTGAFYALQDASDTANPVFAPVRELWQTTLNGPVTASALVMNKTVVVGDQAGFIYGLDRQSGAIAWSIRPNTHPLAAIYDSPVPVEKDVVIGISSNEENAAESNPLYPCCTFRGSVARIDADTGAVVWQRYLVTEAQQRAGSSGATVWSTPAYDPSDGTIYVTTSDNYSLPATDTGEAVIALNAKTGSIKWLQNFRVGDRRLF